MDRYIDTNLSTVALPSPLAPPVTSPTTFFSMLSEKVTKGKKGNINKKCNNKGAAKLCRL